MTETQNLQLKKFEGTDGFDYHVLNENWDAVSEVASNPNLLDNPWFVNPVNQRGFTSDSGSSSGYTIDRWKKDLNCKLHLLDGFLQFWSDNTTHILTQLIDKPISDAMLGKTVTLSIKLLDGSIIHGSGVCPSEYPTGRTNVIALEIGNGYVFDFIFDSLSDRPRVRVYRNEVTGDISVKIVAVKLEIGEHSTLANDSAPNYATELLKCQRYYVRLNGSTAQTFCTGSFTSGLTTADFQFLMPTTMRTTPAVNAYNLSIYSKNVEKGFGRIPVVRTVSGQLIQVVIYSANNAAALGDTALLLSKTANGYIEFSADL